MVDYAAGFKRPFQNIKLLIIGAIIFALISWDISVFFIEEDVKFIVAMVSMPIKILLGFITAGYVIFSAKNILKGSFKMPYWDRLGEMFIRGLIYTIIIFILIGVPAAILVTPVILLGIFVSPWLFALFLLVIPAMILVGYITSAAIMRYVDTYKFKSAFEFKEVFKKCFKIDWFLPFLASVGYSIGLSIAIGIIGLIFAAIVLAVTLGSGAVDMTTGIVRITPALYTTQVIIGIVIALLYGFVQFISGITGASLLAQAYKEIK